MAQGIENGPEGPPLTLAWSPGDIEFLRGALICPTPTPGLLDLVSVLVQQSPSPPHAPRQH